jgi:hypothetical protein
MGGHALIEETIVTAYRPDFLSDRPVTKEGHRGFRDLSSYGPGALKHAPTPKLRMQVLERDGRRCRICGRRPDDHVDVELHVHHIRPWQLGGLTEFCNLITLCHTFHNGLSPHQNLSLYEYTDPQRITFDSDGRASEFWVGVSNYRRAMKVSEIVDLPAQD